MPLAAYNSTHGTVGDGTESLTSKFGISWSCINTAKEALKMALSRIGPDGLVLAGCFSQGGISFEHASKILSASEKSQIVVRTFDFTALFVDMDFIEIHHYIARHEDTSLYDQWIEALIRQKASHTRHHLNMETNYD